MKYIKQLGEINKGDIAAVGGKGANLGEMFNAGFPVPDGFCITGKAFDEYRQKNGFTGSTGSEMISGQLWEELEQEIKKGYAGLGEHVRVAVRSSATAEDLPEASFAGQQETYLNIIGENELFTAVKKCFASLYSARAAAYRKQKNFGLEAISLAVVVQKMVESEVSGVLFTADPIRQDRGHMVMNASWGLGEAVVSGKVTPDTYGYDKRKRRVTDKKLGEKGISIGYGTDGVEERKTLPEKRNQFCLSDKQASEIFEMGQRIERHYGSPQDIEWAVCEDRLYILQSRPITTLEEERPKQPGPSAAQKAVLSNWIEHCPYPLYPLDVEPYKMVDGAKARVFNELGIHTGGELSMDDQGILTLSAGKVRISHQALKIPLIIGKFTDYSLNQRKTEGVFSRAKEALDTKGTAEVSEFSVPQLIKELKSIMKLSERIAYVRFRYNIFPSVVISKLISRRLKQADKTINAFDLLSGLPYKTWEMNMALENLAAHIRDHAELKKAVVQQNETDNSAMTAVLNDDPDFCLKLKAFLGEFGWKSTSSYCAFSSVSWLEDTALLFSLLKVLLNSGENNADQNKYQRIIEKIKKRFGPKKALKLCKRIEEIRQYHVNREESLYFIENCYGLARRIAFELGSRFHEFFEHPEDILFLTLDEVYALPDGLADVKKTVNQRKASRVLNERLWNSLSLGSSTGGQNTLLGISGSRGVCRGRVRKILSLQEFDKMRQGDILVCRYTDPSWTPLFVLASAVVSDTGGPLSHSAIVAREYNIPAVLGCASATELLNDGDEIIVDGNSGTVTLKQTAGAKDEVSGFSSDD